ncbi:extracellular solute-binding protein [Clostridium sp. MCC353]|nr:extracellular solute-binding protein [Clostridium sp. MCC353]
MALILVLLLAISGCAKETVPQEPEKTELVLWYYWDIGKIQRELANLIDEFNESQDQIIVKAQYIPDESFKKRLALSAADDKMPDLALMDSSDFKYMHEMKAFTDLTDQIPQLQGYLPQAVEPCTIDGRIYGMPFGVNCLALYYNKKMMEEAGCRPPETWDEFYDAAVKMTKEGVDGFALSALQSEEAMFSFLPMLWSMGADVDTLDSPEGRNTFRLIENLRDNGVLRKQCISMTLSDLMKQFEAGNIAMMFNTSMAIGPMREHRPELEFGVVSVPSGDVPVTVSGGEIFGVTTGDHEDEAIEFLKFLADKNRMSDYIDHFGLLAPRADVQSGQYPSDDMQKKFIEYYKSARPREFTDQWPKISLVVTDTLSQVIIGERPAEDILKEAALRIREIREEAQ